MHAQRRTISAAPTDAIPNFRGVVDWTNRFKAFDLGGHEVARRVWKDYYAKVDAIVFLVDAVDKERFIESKELDHLLGDDSLAEYRF